MDKPRFLAGSAQRSGCYFAVATLALFFCWLQAATMMGATINYVQGNSATPQTPQTSGELWTVTFTAAQAAGDLNVVAVGWNDSTATVTKVADKIGNTYTLAVDSPPSRAESRDAIDLLRHRASCLPPRERALLRSPSPLRQLLPTFASWNTQEPIPITRWTSRLPAAAAAPPAVAALPPPPTQPI